MVRVWFGNESDGLRRDRKEYVLAFQRPCPDADAAKRFYVDGAGFYVTGTSRNTDGRLIHLAHKKLPSIALSLLVQPDAPPAPPTGTLFDIGIWEEDDWNALRARMAELGYESLAEKTSNPHQKWADYADPMGYLIRFTYTRPPVTQKRLDPNAPREDLG